MTSSPGSLPLPLLRPMRALRDHAVTAWCRSLWAAHRHRVRPPALATLAGLLPVAAPAPGGGARHRAGS